MKEVHFYPASKREVSSLVLVAYLRGQRYKIPTGISIITQYWNPKKQRCKLLKQYPDGDNINKRLDGIEKACRNLLQEISLQNEQSIYSDIASLIRAKIKPQGHIDNLAFTDYIKDYILKSNHSYNTKRRYNTTLNKVVEFQKLKGVVFSFQDINMDFYNALHTYFYSQDQSINYFGDTIKNLKVFFKAARLDGVHKLSLPEKFVTISEDSDSVYLGSDELKLLSDLVIDEILILESVDAKILNVTGNMDRMIKSLQDCRDRFLIGCYTAMRFSDYAFLKGLKSKDPYISRVSEKTSVKTVIPMHPVISQIISRRGEKLPPKVSNQKMNDRLKELCRIAGINSVVEKTITKGGRKVRTEFKKYELVTTHTARRSGCTNMFLAGIDPLSIMAFSGHKTMKSFMKYIKATPQDTAQKLKDHPFFK